MLAIGAFGLFTLVLGLLMALILPKDSRDQESGPEV